MNSPAVMFAFMIKLHLILNILINLSAVNFAFTIKMHVHVNISIT